MPPKPRPQLRKGSIASKDPTDVSINKNKPPPKSSSTKMPPPPDPVPATALGPQILALEESLKEAAVNTAKIFRFYTDARKERIVSHAPHPPRSLTRALGRSLERYDQICDTVETQLLHAISVLERDLKAEQKRLEAEAEASVATRTRSKRPSVSPTATRIPLPGSPPPPGSEQIAITESPTSMFPISQFPPPSGAAVTSIASRRPSAILSSLHRASFPLKLDLSPAALAGGKTDPSQMGQPMDVNVDLGLTSLPSPVTLAPKTARALPNDPTIPDLFGMDSSQGMSTGAPDGPRPSDAGPMTSSVGMKTTGPLQEEVIDLTARESSAGRATRLGTTQLGDSADKPIELDLEGSYDDMDLFGDSNATTAANASVVHANNGTAAPTQLDVDMDGLFTPQDGSSNAFRLDDAMGQNANPGAAPDPGAILASLAANESADGGSNELSSLLPSGANHGHSSDEAFPGLGGESGGESQFDLSSIDLSSFSGLFDAPGVGVAQAGVGGEEDMDIMSQLLAMDGGQTVNPSGSGG